MSNDITIKSFCHIDLSELRKMTSLNIRDYNQRSHIITLDISACVNLVELQINTNSRILTKGLNKCIKLKSLNIINTRFDSFTNNSLESLTINGWYDNEFDPTGCPNLKSIYIVARSRLDVSLLSQLKYLTECEIFENAYGTVTNNSIIELTDTSNVIYGLPNLISYSGNYNKSVFTNKNVKSISFEDEKFNSNAIINLPNLTKLSIESNHIELYNLVASTSKLTDLILYICDVKHLESIRLNNNLRTLDINCDKSVEISQIINKFPYLHNLNLSFEEGTIKIKNPIVCPLKKLSIDSDNTITIGKLKRFNTSNLLSLKCNVDEDVTEQCDIPTLTELYCNKFILINENAANLKIYHGPVPCNTNFTNIEEICDLHNYDIDITSMPKLKLINGVSAQEYIKPYVSVIPHQNPNTIQPKLSPNMSLVDINIAMLTTDYEYTLDIRTYIESNLNGSYFYVKTALIKINPGMNIDSVIDAIVSRLVKLDDEIERTLIIGKMNNIFKSHEYDDGQIIIEKIFIELDGKLGIDMDMIKHELRQRLLLLQQQLDELKNTIL